MQYNDHSNTCEIKFSHTNIIAKDWKSLAGFYMDVFGCRPTYPERNLSGDWVDALTGIKGARIMGMHLALPGFENGPTLEIFEYAPQNPRGDKPAINRQGLGHIAFHVDDVELVVKKLQEHGGKLSGEIIRRQYPELGLLTAAYAQDPEGNFIEIQNWKK